MFSLLGPKKKEPLIIAEIILWRNFMKAPSVAAALAIEPTVNRFVAQVYMLRNSGLWVTAVASTAIGASTVLF